MSSWSCHLPMLRWAERATRGSARSSGESFLAEAREPGSAGQACWVGAGLFSAVWRFPQRRARERAESISAISCSLWRRNGYSCPRGTGILGGCNLLTSYFAQTHTPKKEGDLCLTPPYEELHALRESAKSMSSNCALGGAVKSDGMKIDRTVVEYEYRSRTQPADC